MGLIGALANAGVLRRGVATRVPLPCFIVRGQEQRCARMRKQHRRTRFGPARQVVEIRFLMKSVELLTRFRFAEQDQRAVELLLETGAARSELSRRDGSSDAKAEA